VKTRIIRKIKTKKMRIKEEYIKWTTERRKYLESEKFNIKKKHENEKMMTEKI
jgi:hypothetical protein